MEFFKHLDLKPANMAKVIGIGLAAVFALAFVLSLFGSMMKPGSLGMQVAPGMGGGIFMDGAVSESPMWYGEADVSYSKEEMMGMPELSVRNILPYPPTGNTTGSDAEEFEVTDYSASVETRDRDGACGTVMALKALPYVIFESANEFDTACSYSFKVERAHVEEILTTIRSLNPKDLSENTYSIKRTLNDFTSEMDILEAKLVSIDATLKSALAAYDEITAIATKSADASSLAKIIDSKIQIIERLTMERLNVSSQLERLTRAKADELDRIDYTRFYVSVYENKYVDFEAIADSWKGAVQRFVYGINQAIQDATLNLIALLLALVPYVIYLFILVFGAKYGWKAVRYIWRQ